MGCLYLGEKYPQVRAAISAVGASMWDGSALVFMLFNGAYFAGTSRGEASRLGLSAIALLWMTISIAAGVPTWMRLPTRELILQLRASEEPLDAAAEDGSHGKASTPRVGSFMSHLVRRDTMLLLLFMASYNLKSSFFITTFADQASQMTAEPVATGLATTFNLAFPIGGFLTSIGGALLLERLGEREDIYMGIVSLLAISLGMYNLLPFPTTQFAAALLFGPTRTLQWACYFHFLSLPKRYPPQYVGRLLGYGNLVIALAGDVPIGMLNAFVTNTETFGSATSRYLFVHFLLQLAVMGSGIALPWHLNASRKRELAAADSRARMGGLHVEGMQTSKQQRQRKQEAKRAKKAKDEDAMVMMVEPE